MTFFSVSALTAGTRSKEDAQIVMGEDRLFEAGFPFVNRPSRRVGGATEAIAAGAYEEILVATLVQKIGFEVEELLDLVSGSPVARSASASATSMPETA